jgi:enamine deaminase RidA (YjgF/YER057c/UK114 family)
MTSRIQEAPLTNATFAYGELFAAAAPREVTCVGPFDPGSLASLIPNPGLALHADLFAPAASLQALRRTLRTAGLTCPVTGILVAPDSPGGLHIDLISGPAPRPIRDGGRTLGFAFEDDDARYALLGNIFPPDPAAPVAVQTEAVFAAIERALASVGMTFRQVIRTWFYNDDILGWYDVFNRVRTAYFQQHRVARMPASTGIGAPNASRGALVAKVLAVSPKTPRAHIAPVSSPLQCEASAYGSSFSRAFEVRTRTRHFLTVSGTASIEPGGRTIHPDDTARQIDTTLDVVDAILASRGMTFAHATRAIAYFRDPADVALWETCRRLRDLPAFPVILAGCTICRDDLRFELELDAARNASIP